jgi:hypothetical protein
MRVYSNSYLKNVVNAQRDRAERLELALDPPKPLPLTYQATVTPEFILPSGWAPKPAQPPQHLPFQVNIEYLATSSIAAAADFCAVHSLIRLHADSYSTYGAH